MGNAAANGTSAAGTPQQVNQIPQNITPAPRPATIAPTYQAPAPAPAPQPAPAPVESAPAAPDSSPAVSQTPVSSYYVVSDYTGEAREVVDDAYVRNFDVGARIQLGAFSSEEGAAALTEELNNQGIEAQIYEP